MKADFSVTAVIPVYNGAAVIRRSIESVLAQTHPVDELIVIDDGSTDATADIVAGYGARVRYILQRNSGVAAARNAGIKHAASSWIAFLDHDDEWIPSKLELQISALQSDPGAALCYSAYWFHRIDGAKQLKHLPLADVWPASRLRNPFPPSVVIARRAELLRLGGFDESLKGASCEDWECFVRFLRAYSAVEVSQPLTHYYELNTSSSRDYRQMLPKTLTIVDKTLVSDLSGIKRALWRRRIKGVLYYRAAISAREYGEPAMTYLMRSLSEWPVPDRRIRTLVLEVRAAVTSGFRAGPGKLPGS
ncbi:MAG TPA: glycosyltransferase family A protein [Candidatus Acidoferrales bacterium]|nr:glycosyltransferase family A protein [Candidatus Acidoferrales bacterium]